MESERISNAEVYAALRERGMTALSDAEWVVLETDASFSVIPRQKGGANGDAELLRDVAGPREREARERVGRSGDGKKSAAGRR